MSGGGLERKLRAARRLEAIQRARTDILTYQQLLMPDPNDPDDVTKSQYVVTPQARLLAQILEQVYERKLKRVAVSVGPQSGKSQLISRAAPAYFSGRNPAVNMILGSYNQDFANEFGDDVRAIIESPAHAQVFPEHALRKGGQAKDLLITDKNGKLAFIGVGGSGTGKPADIFIVDDPIRNDDDAQSEVYRQRMWNWFTKVAGTRIHNDSAMVVVHCLAGGTSVTMADGTRKALRAVRPGDSVLSWSGAHVVAAPVEAVVDNGVDRTYLVRTENSEVRANARHPFLVVSEEGLKWVTTEDLRSGMRIARFDAEPTEASNALRRVATSLRSAGGCAARTTTRRSGRRGTVRRQRTTGGVWRTVANGVTGLIKRILTACFRSRAVSAPFAGLTAARGDRGIGSPTSCPTITTKRGRFAASYATTATGSRGELEIPPSWSAPSNTFGPDTDDVVSVTPWGDEHVYDLSVGGAHNFLANGLWTHNTRWHEDDLIGRLCDPDHPERNGEYAGIADEWTYINLPIVVTEPALADALGLTLDPPFDPLVKEQFGDKPMASLWPERFSLPFLASQKRMDRRGFTALRMGKPTPEDGDYFKVADILEYHTPDALPESLRKYGASDHAVSLKQAADSTVVGCVGIDANDDVWVLPDIVWEKMETDATVETLLQQFKAHRPLLWWMESELISKSFGPFLIKRMQEERVYTSIDAVTPSKDKKTRARAIQGRMQMRKVHFPAFAPWWPDAKNQLLKFPYATHDDFVDWLSHIGLGLLKEVPAERPLENSDKVAAVGSIRWTLAQTRAQDKKKKRAASRRGW